MDSKISKARIKYFNEIVIMVLAFTFFSCARTINLDPSDKRPIKKIEVGDATEAALIEQELGIETKYLANNELYFYTNNANVISELEKLGYEISEISPMQTSFKLVQLNLKSPLIKASNEQEKLLKQLNQYKVQVLLREQNHWTIYGSLESLKELVDKGFDLEEVNKEIRPRSIEITVPAKEDIQRVNAIDVDIYSSAENNDGFIIYGGAYDFQIDSLRSLGFQIKITN